MKECIGLYLKKLAKNWIKDIETESTHPKKGIFTEDAETIAKHMARRDVSPKGLGSAIKMIQYYINRAGEDLSKKRKDELEKAKDILQDKLKNRKEVESHLKNGIPIRKNIFKLGSEAYVTFLKTAREMLKLGEIEVDQEDKFLLERIATGKKGIYKGEKVNIESPERIRGGDKKFRVYIDSGKKDKEGNIIAKKIEWGDPDYKIKNYDDEARKNFLNRHKCDEKEDKTKPGWWACNIHLFADQLGLKSDKPW